MIPDIEIIPHVWRYWRAATFQFSGLILFPPRCRVLYRPCVTKEDPEAVEHLEFFAARMPSTVAVEPLWMDRRKLMRRAIGRNECCLASQAPVVWCADVDYLVTADCLDKILTNFPRGANLAHPARIHAGEEARGVELIKSIAGPEVVKVDLAADFPLIQPKYAIGGIQFFAGEYARKAGYCNRLKDTKMFALADRWQPTKCDVRARQEAGGGTAIDVTALYRVRHGWWRSEGMPEDARL